MANKSSKDKADALPLLVRVGWVTLGLAGALTHVMHNWAGRWPDTDWVTMARLGFAALGIILPSVSSIDFPGGGGLKFHEAKEAAVEGISSLENALERATNQTQSWISSVSWLNTYLQRADVDDDAAASAVFRFCLERMEEAKDWMGDENELIRISLWWQDLDDGDLFFMFSNDIRDEATVNYRFRPNRGLMGQAFAENRMYNLEDAPSSAFYVPIRNSVPNYHGLLLAPVRIMDAAVGVVSIDRGNRAEFNENAENVAEALAEQIAYAFSHPRVRGIMLAIPARVNALLLPWRVESSPQAPAPKPSLSSGDSGQPEA